MSPSSGEPHQTPDLKPSGLAGVFKSLTGSRSSKSLAPPALSSVHPPNVNVHLAQQLGNAGTARRPIYGGPSEYDNLYEQLKGGKNLADRLAAADALRHAVIDYPLSGVCCTKHGYI
jgi:hypothetical protein